MDVKIGTTDDIRTFYDLMIITDHINHMNANPLNGPNDDTMGERFPDMSEVYSKELINKELSKSGTTFGKEQERKQYLIYIADSLMKSAGKFSSNTSLFSKG